ncbi:DUF397 domain-containing protein [Streptomyces sp. NPDC059994]|uniref:DUF397 domain-containing protein n=1 Tax=Streptomyces sp. NPDC059994 TaxID=3347029 RepID=UPI0036D0B9CF
MTHTTPASATTAYDLAPESAWRTSSYSNDGSGNCVSVAHLPTTVAVRDSKQPAGPAFQISPTAFTTFIGFAKDTRI